MTATQRHLATGAQGAPLTVIEPEHPARAAVLVIQDAWGVTDHLVGQGAALADRGMLAVLPHLFHRVGDPVIDSSDLPLAMKHVIALRGDEIESDVVDAAGYAVDRGVPAVGIVGFCMGGSIALWAAARGPVDAAVTFYGSGIAQARWTGIPSGLDLALEIKVPWLGLYGDQDQTIPIEQVEQLRAVLADNPVPTEIIRYPDAGHAFATDPASPRHRAAAAADGWARACTWLEAALT